MTNHYTKPIGSLTSIEAVQQQKYNVHSTVGVKRSLAQAGLNPDPVQASNTLHEIHTYSLRDFKRPRLETTNEISHPKASRITNVCSSEIYGTGIYTQKKLLASTPTTSQNPLLSLSHPRYDLPLALVRNFESLGINSIYPWQSSCLLYRGMLAGEKNLVYTAPTGGGKSLVADILMLKAVLRNRKAILVLPYVALVQEKLKWLRRVVEGVEKFAKDDTDSEPPWRKQSEHRSVRVVGFFGGSKVRATWDDVDIAVCTVEKANALVNSAIEEGTIKQLGITVLDELHMIDDDHRGYIMELMATKLLTLEQDIQIVGMSATLSNTPVLAKWLDAKYYESKYKPVPIEEYLVYDNNIYTVSTSSAFFRTASQLNSTQPKPSPTRLIEPSLHAELGRPMNNAVVSLAIETVESGYGALIFCSSRIACQTTANLISEAMPLTGNTESLMEQRRETLRTLRSLSCGLDSALEKLIPRGVAFHHAGLTTEERDIIAETYDHGILKVIVATCSLAAGINLPARRVILQGARMGRDLVGPAMLRQMRGRAGRKGKDEIGESYVCCQKGDLEEVVELLEADLPAVQSCLTPDKRGIKRALLEVIAVKLANHQDAVQDYVRRTLLFHTIKPEDLRTMVKTTIKELFETGLIASSGRESYDATLFGQAVVASTLTPEDGIFVHGEFERAMQAFAMDGEMHVFYMFTPVYSTALGEINWQIFRDEVGNLDDSGLRVLKVCGVNPAFVNRMANGGKQMTENTPKEIETVRIYRRFFAAFQLRDLCNEVPVHVVARKFGVSRGFVQTLAQTCEGFAAGMIKFCERMGWGMLRSVLEHMSDRLKAGARADLLDLAKIPFVKSRTARVFWENGMKSLRAVAEADAKALIPILLLAQSKRSKTTGEEEARYEEKMMLKAELIVNAASRLWEREQQVDIEADL